MDIVTSVLPAIDSTPTTTLYQIWEHHYASDFATGVTLLDRHNPGAVTRKIMEDMRRCISKGYQPNRYLVGKLSDALQATIVNTTAAEPVLTATVTPAQLPGQDASTMPGAMDTPPFGGGAGGGVDSPADPQLITLTSPRAKELHKIVGYHHALMSNAATDEERALHAEQVMEAQRLLDAEYDRLRAIGTAEEGMAEADQVPGIAPILNEKSAADLKKLNSIRPRISKINKELPKANTDKRRAELEKELKEKTAEKERLEKLLA